MEDVGSSPITPSMSRRLLFLDIDGPLTTSSSRSLKDPERFAKEAVHAMQYLLDQGEPDLCIVHSTWRKLPKPSQKAVLCGYPTWSHEEWRDLCKRQGLNFMVALEDAPYKKQTRRGGEIAWWLRDHYRDGDRIVVLDDQMSLIVSHVLPWIPNVCLVPCDDDIGLTLEQAHEAVAFWHGV